MVISVSGENNIKKYSRRGAEIAKESQMTVFFLKYKHVIPLRAQRLCEITGF